VDLLQSVTGQGAGTVNTPAGPDLSTAPGPELDNAAQLAVLISLTAGSTPSLTPTVQWSYVGSTWFDGDPADTMTAIAAVGAKAKSFTRKAPFHRVSVVVAGFAVAYTVRAWCFG
jgi:hypothetical protein